MTKLADLPTLAEQGRRAVPKSDLRLRVEEKRSKRLADEKAERAARIEVTKRDGRGCCVPGCKEKGHHLHHLTYRSQSRAKRWDARNLVYVCKAHHDLVHAHRITIMRDATGELIVRGERKDLEFKL